MNISLDTWKRVFYIIAYLAYTLSVIISNQLKIDLGNYQYIFVVIIGASLKMADSVHQINQILTAVNMDDIVKITDDLKAASVAFSQGGLTNRMINEPITPHPSPKEELTHREIPINEHYTLHIGK